MLRAVEPRTITSRQVLHLINCAALLPYVGVRILTAPRVGRRNVRRQAVRLQSGLRSVGRTGTTPVQHRRQGQSAGNQQKRRQEHPAPAGPVRPRRHAAARPAVWPARRLGAGDADKTTLERGGLRTREQAGAHYVGAGDPQHQIRCRSARHACLSPRSRTTLYRSTPSWFCDR